MDVLSYHIVIKTPIGYRVGDISLDIEGNNIRGTLRAPFFEPALSGELHEDSTLSLTVSLIYEEVRTECTATGRISGYAIHISVPVGNFVYEIDGTITRNKW